MKKTACLAMLLPVLFAMPATVAAEGALLRPSAHLLFKQPELVRAGSCVLYREGGEGWGAVEPRFYLRGEVVAAQVQTRRLAACPVVAGKTLDRYSRAEFVAHARAFPCLAPEVPARDEQIGVVRLRVRDWETPHARRAENAGRLYRGQFLDQPLKVGLEVELEADLLGACE